MPNFYISPTGSGNKSGSDWANTAALTSMDGAIRKAGSGGTVLLAADLGSYKMTNSVNIWSGASFADAVTIKGVNSKTGADQEAVIEGTRPATYAIGNASGNELFKFQKGAGNLTFEHLQVNNTATAFRAAGDVANITIEHVDADNVAHFFQTYIGSGNKSASVTNLALRDIDVEGFSKGLIEIGYNSSNVLIQDVRADSERQDGDEFAMGVHITGTTHDIVLRRVTMENATDTTGGKYWNGDGFATEKGVYNVLFEDTIARGNTDAGYDLKSKSTTLVRTLAEDNSRNYRIWGDTTMIDVVGLNPDKRGGPLNGQNQIHIIKGASLTIEGGYFADAGSGTRVFLNEGGSVTISDVQVVRAATGALKTGTIGGLTDAMVTLVDAVGKNSAGLLPTDPLIAAPVVTGPNVTAPVTSIPVTVVPVVTLPVLQSPASGPGTSPASLPSGQTDAPATTIPAVSKFAGTAAADVFNGTTGHDQFRFDQTVNRGADKIVGFDTDDILVMKTALADGNGDGIITFGRNGLLDLGAGGGTLKLDLAKGLRLLGQTDDGFVYGNAAVRPNKSVEGKLTTADTLTGDAKDKATNAFFFDTDLNLDLGKDKIVNFGSKDFIISTSKLAENGTSTISTHDGVFSFHDGLDLGTVGVTDLSGRAVTALEFDGEQTSGGTHYYVYSLVGSTTAMPVIGG
ncbi:hypothetical protein NHF48_023015 [Sphingomonas sp. H160509]|uniref:hypothetical protein n=1 Tax=Sphingomonas sp. H160509 TaxID=2955313 RepID=UPI002096B50B|nr:hypothetical protein [Sphingomonas sp. H160509]MDD1453143.1 hypothetical protein [Sphingomonas sp. H160509]